ncbi:Asp-tRNA(Asn)/Glu-tRNA(Gln) amidotransferase subunit GatC [Propioniciclava sp. MC1595]|uniref:Asp-tRNA(Asn)/Glu-tRNA(Gln) amidotransferase subunit GatC n=1 Tax=unclassified Propioniciclava TaxID=2642922 RepID=UPI00160025FC|nr:MULTISPECIES: Asp-tRNA(Asn)/Glu-tRNA(Gln) amidotransferase subunit GatC [unclassified Propioniciclava]MBB1495328.1 Asp-tRNA(Asn)/Glu-tRNA(Gln) amidotransferase subunit GatC [Propioniciclava sp. MC1595]MBB1500726.1 Asp-tRNA(Asn)/Glu-tRNA(Gln) amidotransferase subunit GatC [Propioniciclava sp. MC1683]QTE24720.1 Asp-tRNA(Asn)/Glu-tRNA(Gln) amidotransferase subunit GatC [Propioniciclava sp. MC1595]
MALTTDDVAQLAALARIELTDQELERMAPELAIILEAVASVSEVADADVPPMSHAMPLTNVFREDVVRPGLTQEQALAGAPATDEGKFLVPRILGEEA